MTNMVFCFLKTQTFARTTKNEMSNNFLNHVIAGPKIQSFLARSFSPTPCLRLPGVWTKTQWLHAGVGHHTKNLTQRLLWGPWRAHGNGGYEGRLSVETHRMPWGQTLRGNSLLQDRPQALLTDSWIQTTCPRPSVERFSWGPCSLIIKSLFP